MDLNVIYYEDCIEGIRNRIDENQIDLIVADPPFGIDFHKMGTQYHRKADFVVEGYNEIPTDQYYEFTYNWLKESHRVLKDTGSCYVISGWSNLREVLNAIEKVNLKIINHIIWKYQFGVFTKRKFVTSHYHILFTVKNPKAYLFNKIDHYPEDVWIINRPYAPGKEKNSTKLPEALIQKIILYSSQEQSLVLDPFIGNGTTAIVCMKTHRNYLGFERNVDCQRLIELGLEAARLELKAQVKKELDQKAQKSLTQYI